MEGEDGTGLQNLDTDLLAHVLSYLPQNDLLEVILVSKHWEEAARLGRKKVEVSRWWDLGGQPVDEDKSNQILSRVLGGALDVRFVHTSKLRDLSMSVLRLLNPALLHLEFPVTWNFGLPVFPFPPLLSNLVNLKSLSVKGESWGTDPVHIVHPTLEVFEIEFEHLKPRAITVDCPSLTHLSTAGDANKRRTISGSVVDLKSPSLNCPRLTSLCLAARHCALDVLESISVHAPAVRVLDVYRFVESPVSAITHFTALRSLTLKGCKTEDLLRACTVLPHLERLYLRGHFFARNVEVRHPRVKVLEVCQPWTLVSVRLVCESLEELHLMGGEIQPHILENINSSCPKLKSMHVTREDHSDEALDKEGEREFAEQAPLELHHVTLEELELSNVSDCFHLVHIRCPKLRTLVLVAEPFWDRDFDSFKCPNLTRLELCCDYVSRLPSMLSVFPSLRSLKISAYREDSPAWTQVEVEHSQIKDLVIEKRLLRLW